MTELIRIVAGVCSAAVITAGGANAFRFPFFPIPTPPSVVEESEDQTQEDILGEYIDGILEDSKELQGDVTGIVDDYVLDTMDMINEFIKNPNQNHEEFVNMLEKRAEDLADELESAGEKYGHLQEFKGKIFGDRFDKKTAETVINIITNVLMHK